MFEQTLLTQPAPAQKTGAFAISLTAQMCVFGVLIVGPLIYTQTLPLFPPKLGLELRIGPPAPPPPFVQQTTTPPETAATPTIGVPRRTFVVRTTPSARAYTGPAEVSLANVDAGDFLGEVGVVPVGNVGAEPSMRIGATATEPAPMRAATIATPVVEQPAKPITVSGAVLASKLVTKVVPKYPSMARISRVSGMVRLLGTIGVDGRVKALRVIDGHVLLRKAAEDAVWQWVYSPTYLGAQPVEVEAAIEVNFALN